MRNRLLFDIPAASAALAALLAAFTGGTMEQPGVTLSGEEAAAIRGGDTTCGTQWEAGEVSCPAGTVLCGQQVEKCTDDTHTSLVPIDGTTGEEVDSAPIVTCRVCGGTTCGFARPVQRTRPADCDGS